MATPFSKLSLSPDLLTVLTELGYSSMTEIQRQSLPPLLEGKDVVGQSKTGSGKTTAFALPILNKLRLGTRTTQALILCPTRELCAQVAREIRKLGRRHAGLQVLVVAGGQPARPQIAALQAGVHIVVGTPGRLVDLIERGVLPLQSIDTLVLDEADRMLDMGFADDMKVILREVPGTRQTVFFSATYLQSIADFSRKYQHEPVQIAADESNSATSQIIQLATLTTTDEKSQALIQVLQSEAPESALVFCNLKITVAELTRLLATKGLDCASLHGDLEQRDRDVVMAKFRNGSTRILIATDVAARGLDILGLDLVINYDLPHQPDIYVHRIGRTGRAGRPGRAISLVVARNTRLLQEIEGFTGVPIQRQPLQQSAARPRPAQARPALMRTLQICKGRKDKIRPGDILGALTGATGGGLSSESVGKIEIHDHISYVAVAKELAPVALERLKSGRIKGMRCQVYAVL